MGILSKYGVNVPRGEIAITPEQARDVADKFGKTSHKISLEFPSLHYSERINLLSLS